MVGEIMRVENLFKYKKQSNDVLVYIGRNYEYWRRARGWGDSVLDYSCLANPYSINEFKSYYPIQKGEGLLEHEERVRLEVIKKYVSYLINNEHLLTKIKELKELDKKRGVNVVLLCFCKPKLCHGDVIVQVASCMELGISLEEDFIWNQLFVSGCKQDGQVTLGMFGIG